ncbi:MTH895/ArsE family thioredoxin-like protein [Calditrichota bacterium LG25]
MEKIQVYGTGCASCEKLFNLARQAVQELGVDIEVEKIEDLNAMALAGVMRTPGLAFDGRVVLQGKLPTLSTLKNWIQQEHRR